MYNDLLNKTCNIYRMNAIDGYDFTLSEEGEVTESTTLIGSEPCRLEPASTPRDRTEGGLLEMGAQTLFLKANSNIREHDRVEINNKWYRVSALREVYGLHDLHHYEATLTVVDREADI